MERMTSRRVMEQRRLEERRRRAVLGQYEVGDSSHDHVVLPSNEEEEQTLENTRVENPGEETKPFQPDPNYMAYFELY
nr:hypothetical protein Itr_chr12CG18660 [Ipomoea trifida]